MSVLGRLEGVHRTDPFSFQPGPEAFSHQLQGLFFLADTWLVSKCLEIENRGADCACKGSKLSIHDTGLLPPGAGTDDWCISHQVVSSQESFVEPNPLVPMTFAKLLLPISILFFCSLTLSAQTTIADLVKEWERAKAYTLEYLEAMPEDAYSMRPTPEMRSFAEQMLHLTDGNYGIVSVVMGVKSPIEFGDSEKVADKSKANVIKLVLAGYDFVINGLKAMKDAQLQERVTLFNQYEMSKSTALTKIFEHQTHHRGQTTVYLRLAGVKPPQEKLF